MSNLFKPNWKGIYAALANPEKRKEVGEELAKIRKKIDAKRTEIFQAEKLKLAKDRKDTLLSLPVGEKVYYKNLGFPQIKYNAEGIKKKDGRKYMTVEFDGKLWQCSYESLCPVPDTALEAQSKVVSQNIINSIFRKE